MDPTPTKRQKSKQQYLEVFFDTTSDSEDGNCSDSSTTSHAKIMVAIQEELDTDTAKPQSTIAGALRGWSDADSAGITTDIYVDPPHEAKIMEQLRDIEKHQYSEESKAWAIKAIDKVKESGTPLPWLLFPPCKLTPPTHSPMSPSPLAMSLSRISSVTSKFHFPPHWRPSRTTPPTTSSKPSRSSFRSPHATTLPTEIPYWQPKSCRTLRSIQPSTGHTTSTSRKRSSLVCMTSPTQSCLHSSTVTKWDSMQQPTSSRCMARPSRPSTSNSCHPNRSISSSCQHRRRSSHSALTPSCPTTTPTPSLSSAL